jgi:hypothetical protein
MWNCQQIKQNLYKIFSSPCQRPSSLGVCRPLTFHILIFSSETPQPNELKLGRKMPIRNKNCLWWPCLLMDRDEISNIYRGPSIDASYQVSVHLAEGFQRRRLKCEKLMDDRRQVMMAFGKVS